MKQFETSDTQVTQAYAMTTELWAVAYGGMRLLDWHGPLPSNEMSTAWGSPDGRVLRSLTAYGSALFFDTAFPAREFEENVWTEGQGWRTLIPFDATTGTAACCLVTDGKDLVWSQGAGLTPGGSTFSDVSLMTSPFATHDAALKPRRLRTTPLDDVLGAWQVMGAGHVLTLEQVGTTYATYRLVVTRVSDGAFWIVPNPGPGFLWWQPLYVDQDELAVIKARQTAPTAAHAYSIVRQAINVLGAPEPPSTGP